MTAPYLDDWSPAVIVASNTALRTLLDAHATDPASITIHDAADVLLAEILLEKPCGSVDSETGALLIVADGREEEAPAGGTAAYATIRDGAGGAHRSVPCEAGTEPVAGKCVLNTTTIVQGGPVELVGMVVE